MRLPASLPPPSSRSLLCSATPLAQSAQNAGLRQSRCLNQRSSAHSLRFAHRHRAPIMSTRSVEMQETRKPNAADAAAKDATTNGTQALSAASASVATPASSACPTTLTLILSRVGSYGLLNDVYRRYLTTHLESGQVWYLLSLSLLSAGAYDECFLAVRECLKRHPNDVPALLLASQLCVNRLKKWKESVEYSARALRGIKAQISQRAAHAQQGAIAAALAAAATAKTQESTPSQQPAAPATSIAALAAAAPAASSSSSALLLASSASPSPASSFVSLTHNVQIESSLLLTAQMLFGLSCSKYAYHVSTFSNRKSLQKRALHALEAAYNCTTPAAAVASSSPSSPSAPLGAGNKKLSFYLACLYADIREIPRALATLKKCLLLDRSFGPGWNLLALLLSAQKKYASAVRATENGLSQLTGGAGVSALPAPQGPAMDRGAISEEVRQALPLLLTKARLLSHVGNFDESVSTFNELVRLTFDAAIVHFKPVGGPSKSFAASSAVSVGGLVSQSAASAARLRPVLAPSRNRDESTEKFENSRTDAGTPAEVEWASTKVEVLLALAACYAAQAAAQASGAGVVGSMGAASQSGPGSRDESLLADAFDAVFLARELAPTSLLADVHASLAALHVQSGRPSQSVRHFESALVLESNHTVSLIGLARIENQRGVAGNRVLAYGYLMSALQVDATSHHAWYEMGLILQSQGKASPAAEHFLTALELEKTAPIASFATIRREFV